MLITVCRLHDSRPDAHPVIVALGTTLVPTLTPSSSRSRVPACRRRIAALSPTIAIPGIEAPADR
jgi:hypothetical protein